MCLHCSLTFLFVPGGDLSISIDNSITAEMGTGTGRGASVLISESARYTVRVIPTHFRRAQSRPIEHRNRFRCIETISSGSTGSCVAFCPKTECKSSRRTSQAFQQRTSVRIR